MSNLSQNTIMKCVMEFSAHFINLISKGLYYYTFSLFVRACKTSYNVAIDQLFLKRAPTVNTVNM